MTNSLEFITQAAQGIVSFEAGMKFPKVVQQLIFKKRMQELARTTWGKEHGIKPFMSYKEFRQNIPVMNYEDVKPYIDRILQGEENVLTNQEVAGFFRSTSQQGKEAKNIPYAQGRLNQFARIGAVWGTKYARKHPQIYAGKTIYFSAPETEETRIINGKEKSFGSVSGKQYALLKEDGLKLFRKKLLLDKEILNITDPTERMIRIAEVGLAENVTHVGTSTAATYYAFLNTIKEHRTHLAKYHRKEGNHRVANTLQEGRFTFQDFWPNMAQVSLILHGNGKLQAEKLKKLFGNCRFYDSGVLSSEAHLFLNLLYEGTKGVLLYNENFYELRSIETGEILLPWQANLGRYEAIVTTEELTRYATGDVLNINEKWRNGLVVVEFAERVGTLEVNQNHVYRRNITDTIEEVKKLTNNKHIMGVLAYGANELGERQQVDFIIETEDNSPLQDPKEVVKQVDTSLVQYASTHGETRGLFGKNAIGRVWHVKTGTIHDYFTNKARKGAEGQIKPDVITEEFDVHKKIPQRQILNSYKLDTAEQDKHQKTINELVG